MGTCQTKLDLGDVKLEASSDKATELLKLQLNFKDYNVQSQLKIDELTKKYLDSSIADAAETKA